MADKHMKSIYKELYKVRNPHLSDLPSGKDLTTLRKKVIKASKKEKSKVKGVSFRAYTDLVTSRNRNLINVDEQQKLSETTVAFYGMSVGSSAARTWVMLSRAAKVKIIDPDTIEATNLNRIDASWENIGVEKVRYAEKVLKKINPFVEVYTSNHVEEKKVKKFFYSKPNVDVVVDEIDSFSGKVLLRNIAKNSKLPLISAADVGDNVILDIERYDIDPNVKPFLGRVENIDEIDYGKLSNLEKKKLIIQLVGFEGNSERMLESLLSIGGSIRTWPQLPSTASIAGGVIATTIKKVVLGESVKSGRYIVSMDDLLVSDFFHKSSVKRRNKIVDEIKNQLNEL